MMYCERKQRRPVYICSGVVYLGVPGLQSRNLCRNPISSPSRMPVDNKTSFKSILANVEPLCSNLWSSNGEFKSGQAQVDAADMASIDIMLSVARPALCIYIQVPCDHTHVWA